MQNMDEETVDRRSPQTGRFKYAELRVDQLKEPYESY